jgi:hypothetical protein
MHYICTMHTNQHAISIRTHTQHEIILARLLTLIMCYQKINNTRCKTNSLFASIRIYNAIFCIVILFMTHFYRPFADLKKIILIFMCSCSREKKIQ